MSIEQTRNWIAKHKRKVDAQERWDGALEDTRTCAAEAARASGGGLARATAYYNCRARKTLAQNPTHRGLFNVRAQ